MRSWIPLILLSLAVSFAVQAVEWEEVEWATTVVPDAKTGAPTLLFSLGLAYDETPETMRLRFSWEVFRVDGGIETMLYEYARTTSERQGLGRIYSASERVSIEAGGWYGVRVRMEDLANGLSYSRSASYIAPRSLVAGMRFVCSDGTEEADVTGMSDKELEELVLMQRALASFEVLARNVLIADLFSRYAVSTASYPMAVVLLPDTGVTSQWGSETKPITVTFDVAVLAFTLASEDAVPGFREQLAQYDDVFRGTVLAGTPGAGLGRGAVVFLHDAMDVILSAAAEEWKARSR